MLSGAAQQVPEPTPRDVPPLARPRRPWDLCQPSEREWFDILGEGLVVVWPAPAPAAGMWPPGGGAWVHVAPSGLVTAFTGKVDVGQDNQTAFRLLVAEEMAVRPGDVRVVQGTPTCAPLTSGRSAAGPCPMGASRCAAPLPRRRRGAGGPACPRRAALGCRGRGPCCRRGRGYLRPPRGPAGVRRACDWPAPAAGTADDRAGLAGAEGER